MLDHRAHLASESKMAWQRWVRQPLVPVTDMVKSKPNLVILVVILVAFGL